MKKLYFTTILLVLNLCVYFGIRSMWSGIIRVTFNELPYILLGVLVLITITSALFIINNKKSLIIFILGLVINLLFLGLNGYIISNTLDSTPYFIRESLYNLLFVLGIALIVFLWIQIPKYTKLQKSVVHSILLIILCVLGVAIRFDIRLFNDITCTPVVYAVGEKYQITFTTKSKGTAWVSIDGKEYNDTYAGYRKTENTIHKISVPMEVLDNAKEYTLNTRAMYLRGPYCALQGKIISKTFNWKGVNPDDGINYYLISDNHTTIETPYQAATYFGDSLDFLVSCGDTVNWIDRESDLRCLLKLAGKITKGEIPVIYARGNHETKGVRAHEYYQYVGANGEKFYYTFRLKNIWGVVLDVGENHGDKYSEFYGAAKFTQYRKSQTKFLDKILANAEEEFDAPGVDYRIAICHIPLTAKYLTDHAASYKDEWVERLNQMKITMLYGGHVHELLYMDSNYQNGNIATQCEEYSGKSKNNKTRIMGLADFPAILVSRRASGQTLDNKEYVFDDGFIGLAVSTDGNETVMKYTNEKHEVLDNIISAWYSYIQYGSEIRVKNVK